jgi:hypothetical protein
MAEAEIMNPLAVAVHQKTYVPENNDVQNDDVLSSYSNKKLKKSGGNGSADLEGAVEQHFAPPSSFYQRQRCGILEWSLGYSGCYAISSVGLSGGLALF